MGKRKAETAEVSTPIGKSGLSAAPALKRARKQSDSKRLLELAGVLSTLFRRGRVTFGQVRTAALAEGVGISPADAAGLHAAAPDFMKLDWVKLTGGTDGNLSGEAVQDGHQLVVCPRQLLLQPGGNQAWLKQLRSCGARLVPASLPAVPTDARRPDPAPGVAGAETQRKLQAEAAATRLAEQEVAEVRAFLQRAVTTEPDSKAEARGAAEILRKPEARKQSDSKRLLELAGVLSTLFRRGRMTFGQVRTAALAEGVGISPADAAGLHAAAPDFMKLDWMKLTIAEAALLGAGGTDGNLICEAVQDGHQLLVCPRQRLLRPGGDRAWLKQLRSCGARLVPASLPPVPTDARRPEDPSPGVVGTETQRKLQTEAAVRERAERHARLAEQEVAKVRGFLERSVADLAAKREAPAEVRGAAGILKKLEADVRRGREQLKRAESNLRETQAQLATTQTVDVVPVPVPELLRQTRDARAGLREIGQKVRLWAKRRLLTRAARGSNVAELNATVREIVIGVMTEQLEQVPSITQDGMPETTQGQRIAEQLRALTELAGGALVRAIERDQSGSVTHVRINTRASAFVEALEPAEEAD